MPEVGSPVERDHWARLQIGARPISGRRATSRSPTTIPARPAQAAALLRSRVVPRRETILEVLDQLAALQAEANQRRQAEANALYQQVRTRLLSMGGATLLRGAVRRGDGVAARQPAAARRSSGSARPNSRTARISSGCRRAWWTRRRSERRKLARELHDEVGQALTAVKMDIGIALRSDNRLRVRGALEEASELTETTLRGVRDLSQLLHPSMLDDFGLPTTLTTYLRSFSQRTGIRAQLAETIDDRLVPAIEVCVYRIVQEAFNNIASTAAPRPAPCR